MLDEWDDRRSDDGDEDGRARGGGGIAGAPRGGLNNELFQVALLEGEAAQGHGNVTAVAAGNNCVAVGTSHAWVVRYDFLNGRTSELELSKSTNASVQRVFVDPTGSHLLATLRAGGGFETHYAHATWKKSRLLKKIVSMAITAVGWNRQAGSEASTRDVVLGTGAGTLHELWVDEKDKKEKHVKMLFDLSKDDREPVIGIQVEVVIDSRGAGGGGAGAGSAKYFVMAATPSRYYIFAGGPSLATTFAGYAKRQPLCVALPTPNPAGQLIFYSKAGGRRAPERFAWSSGEGIYHGTLSLGALQIDSSECIASPAIVPYPPPVGGAPLALAVTEYTYVMLTAAGRLVAINSVSEVIVADIPLAAVAPGAGPFLGIATDAAAGTFYLYAEGGLYEVVARDEGRDMWTVHLARREYAQALEHCRTTAQRDQVLTVQAEEAFGRGDFVKSATLWAKTTSAASFEQIALKFVEAGDPEALRTFLLFKQDHIPKDRRAQLTLVATWLCELYLVTDPP